MNAKLRFWLLTTTALLALLLGGSGVSGAAADRDTHVRWDIISLQPPNVQAGGMASALAEDGSQITLTGTGTFETGEDDDHAHADGGGTWETFDAAGGSTGSGDYEVTGLVQWEQAPGMFPPVTDGIGDPATTSAGLAVLRIEYSDGSHGLLVVSCHLDGTPDTVFEGVNATKGFVHYYDNVAPVDGVDANRTLFHVLQEDEGEDGDEGDEEAAAPNPDADLAVAQGTVGNIIYIPVANR